MKRMLVGLLLLAGSAHAIGETPVRLADGLVINAYEAVSRTSTGKWYDVTAYASGALSFQYIADGGKSATLYVDYSFTNTGGAPIPSYRGEFVGMTLSASTASPVSLPTPLPRFIKFRLDQTGPSAASCATVWVSCVMRQTEASTSVMQISGAATVNSSEASPLTVQPKATSTWLIAASVATSGSLYTIPTGTTATSSGYIVSVGGTAVNLWAGLPATVTHIVVVNQSTSTSIFLGGSDVTSTRFAFSLVKFGGTDGPNAFVADATNKASGLWAININGNTTTAGVHGW